MIVIKIMAIWFALSFLTAIAWSFTVSTIKKGNHHG
jgi:hypothetical protein